MTSRSLARSGRAKPLAQALALPPLGLLRDAPISTTEALPPSLRWQRWALLALLALLA